MKKVKTRTKLVGAVAALTVAVALSAGTTFAWFTTNSSSTVGSINATVTGGGANNIMVAIGHGASTVNFQTSLDADDITDWLESEYGDENVLDAVTVDTSKYTIASSTGAVSFKDLSKSADEGTYLKIPITIKTDTADSIYLNTGSTVTGSETVTTAVTAWKTISAGTYDNGTDSIDQGESISAYAYNATRVGITSLEDTGVASTSGTETNMKVWSANEGRYDGAATTGESGTFGSDDVLQRTSVTSDTTNTNNHWKRNLAGDYYDYVNDTGEISATEYSNYLITYGEKGTNTAEARYTIASTTQLSGASSEDPAYAFVYIYVWIEGTDGDCFNSILSQSLSITISLTSSKTLAASKISG